ncbi:MAG: Nuclease subunit of the excinuclease complex [Rickettsiales bacterium]|jgi:excinuclease ABC subunit C|nr:Nuclease subunit of the excinuclease complex [Rickettsiales bacterium]
MDDITTASSHSDTSPDIGVEVIRRMVATLTDAPGVYRMLDHVGKPLYVGKARNLSKRVVAYTHPEKLPYRLQRMIAHTASMEIQTTHTEAEALLLEANIIKHLRPRYNILLKDDKSFPYILMTTDQPYPRITKHRGSRNQKGKYFGPFASAGSVNEAIAQLQKIFLLRPCSDNFFANRVRPCLEYQIKRCSAPCVEKITRDDYRELVTQALDFLSGKSREVQELLARKMDAASSNMQYEEAARYRDRIAALTHIQSTQHVNVSTLSDADILGLYRNGAECCIEVLFYRGGQNFGNASYFPNGTEDLSDAEILEAFIGQFYQTHLPPRQVVVSHPVETPEILEEALSMLAEYTVKLLHPKGGDKQKVLEVALSNAQAALKRRHETEEKEGKLLAQLATLIERPLAELERIEVYDNSHTMGTYPIGAMIVATRKGFLRQAYRRHTIRSNIQPGDDYAMMREVITRRFLRAQKDAPERTSGIWPDLLVIDGGRTHLEAVLQALATLGIHDQAVISISKGPGRKVGEEQFHLPGREAFTLPPTDQLAQYLQRLRDEAHGYAIGSHRKKRGQSVRQSTLDSITGIGAKRKKALLTHFGSAKAVGDAKIEDLMKVDGINRAIAEEILRHLRG